MKVNERIYQTSEEIAEAFNRDWWNGNATFRTLTKKEALELKYNFVAAAISNGHKFFVMKETGYIFNENGNLILVGGKLGKVGGK